MVIIVYCSFFRIFSIRKLSRKKLFSILHLAKGLKVILIDITITNYRHFYKPEMHHRWASVFVNSNWNWAIKHREVCLNYKIHPTKNLKVHKKNHRTKNKSERKVNIDSVYNNNINDEKKDVNPKRNVISKHNRDATHAY